MTVTKTHGDGSTEEQRGPLGACFLVTRKDESGRLLAVVIDAGGEILLRHSEGEPPQAWTDALCKWSPVLKSAGRWGA
jgi:hypothetical protein